MITMKAMAVAIKAHAGQTRADRKTPYILHPVRVAQIIVEATDPSTASKEKETMITAAILHDVLEDSGKRGSTKFSYDDLEKEFGQTVAFIVKELTQDQALPKD